jgi:Amt family ammonium transporter
LCSVSFIHDLAWSLLFYGGLVRSKNVLSVVAQCFGLAGLVTILWWAVGYSFVFGKSFDGTLLGHIFGGSEYFFLNGVNSLPNTDYAYWTSQNVFSMYQLMFAIITPALIVGAIAERMKFSALMLFMTGWMFLVYFPMAHAIWGISGDMNGVWNAKASIKADRLCRWNCRSHDLRLVRSPIMLNPRTSRRFR